MKWKRIITILMALIISVNALGLANAYDFDPGRDINLRDRYDLKNVKDGNFACINLSGTYRCTWPTGGVGGGDKWIIDLSYLYNDTDTLYFNETKLNQTIDIRAIAAESDPFWTQNWSDYNASWSSTYNSTYNTWAYNQTTPAINTILGFSYYNLTDFSIANYYLKSNPFGFYNSTDFDINNYYLKSNPFGFWNDTYATFNKTYADNLYLTSYTESDPLWTGNQSLYSTTATILGWNFWNDTYATFNKTYADTLYSGIEWDYNQTIPAITYGDATFITLANEGNLDVNRSDWWDDLNDPTDITGLVDSQISNLLTINASGSVTWAALTSYPATCTPSQYISTIGDSIVCSAISITESQINDFGSYINTSSEGDLDVNRSDWWDDLNTPADISGSDIVNDLNWINTSGEADQLWSGNWTNVAFTNIDETFDENLIVTKNFTVDTKTFFVDSNANKVGIGALVPTQELDVNGSVNISTNLYVATISGNLGVGTPNPTSKLHVIGDANITGTTYSTFVGDGSGLTNVVPVPFNQSFNRSISNVVYLFNLQDVLVLGNTASASSARLEVYENATDATIMIHEDYGTHDAILQFRRGADDWQITHNQNLSFQFEEVEKMVIRQDGNVGIGTTTPQEKLHVKGGSVIIDPDAAAVGLTIYGDADFRGTFYQDSSDRFNIYNYDSITGPTLGDVQIGETAGSTGIY